MDRTELRTELVYIAVALEAANAIKKMLAYEGVYHDLVVEKVVSFLDREERTMLGIALERYNWKD